MDIVYIVWLNEFTSLRCFTWFALSTFTCYGFYRFMALLWFTSFTLCPWLRYSAPTPHPCVHEFTDSQVKTMTMLTPFTRGRHGLGSRDHGFTLDYMADIVCILHVLRIRLCGFTLVGISHTVHTVERGYMVYTGTMTPHSWLMAAAATLLVTSAT